MVENEIIKEVDIILNTYTIGELQFYISINHHTASYYDYDYDNLLIMYRENVKKNKECGYNSDGLLLDDILIKDIILIKKPGDHSILNNYFENNIIMNSNKICDLWFKKANYKIAINKKEIICQIFEKFYSMELIHHIIKDYDKRIQLKSLLKPYYNPLNSYCSVDTNLTIKYHLKKEIQEIKELENQIKELKIQNNRIIVLSGIILSIMIIKKIINF
jgi:hypothetical protein